MCSEEDLHLDLSSMKRAHEKESHRSQETA